MQLCSCLARPVAVITGMAVAAALALGSVPGAHAAPPEPVDPPSAEPGRYIVVLKQKPIATYGGEVKGLSATRPAKGKRVEVTTKRAKRYRAYLERQQELTAARVGAKADKHYAVALNGYGTTMTADQARTLRRAPGVLSVVKDTPRTPTDNKNPVDFLRLSGTGGVWSALGGKDKAGKGVVVGVLDTGIWPESASFAGQPLGRTPLTAVGQPYRSGATIRMKKSDGQLFRGACESGERARDDFGPADCNTKIVSARYFASAYKEGTPAGQRTDYLSPRDGEGHGTHTGSTAVGNAGVSATVDGRAYGKISGVAPAAKIASYKVCFTSVSYPESTCFTADSLDAIEQAVEDGVDVINYSISSSDDLLDPVDLAFKSAAAAGIFVATSAGNSGPGASTLDHVAPWLTTVAASTVGPYAATVVLGNGKKYAGISTTVRRTVGGAPLVKAAAVRLSGESAADASVCLAGTLDRAKTRGKIVVCDRGVNDRVAKSDEVKRAGGLGMVLVNLTAGSEDGDSHVVPTVHLNVPSSLAVRSYAARTGARARLEPGNISGTPIRYPRIAAFSSRGPALGVKGNLLKPDIAAPGVSILAAVAPPSNRGRKFDFNSGTSMASPHIAGIAALYFGKQPRWSPMAVKSAIMTTAGFTKNPDGSVNRDAYAQGAGNVRPHRMFDPGVIFDAGHSDWQKFIDGTIDRSDYNSPSIAVGKLVGSKTITRRVTAVTPGTYTLTVGVPGVTTSVTPSSLVFSRRGQTKTIEIKLSRRSAPLGETAFGSLYLRGAGTVARLPIAVTPQAVDAPDLVTSSSTAGSLSYQVKAGFSGAFPTTEHGLVAADRERGEVSAAEAGAEDEYTYNVPANAVFAKFIVAADDPAADIDLLVYRVVDGGHELVAESATSSGTEEVLLTDPEPGEYVSIVAPFSDPPGQTSTNYTYTAVGVGPSAGNYSVTDPTVTLDVPFTLTATWSALNPAEKYYGWIEYDDGSGTFIEIN